VTGRDTLSSQVEMNEIDRATAKRKANRTILLILGGFVVLLVVAVLLFVNFAFREPLGPRDCECELLDQWAADLPITPAGDTLGIGNVNTSEGVDVFSIGGSTDEPSAFDEEAIIQTLTGAGFAMRVDRDDDEMWNASFFPGEGQYSGPWYIDFTRTQGGIGFQVGVEVDGSPWGLETIEDLWDSYYEDRVTALDAQDERQREAIAILDPLKEAMMTMNQSPAAPDS
jgi:hypothetical protein